MTPVFLFSIRDARIRVTLRTVEIVRQLAEGKRVIEIANGLGTAVDTVHEQLDGVRNRLGVRTNPALVRIAIHHGFVELTESGTVQR